MYDIIIKNGYVVDGTGNPWFKADIGVKGDKIVDISDSIDDEAEKIIDATNLVVSPGFIDVHGHSDYLLLANPKAENKLMQGVTTEVAGNCGFSAAPLGKKWLVDWWVADKPRDEKGERIWTVPWDEAQKICKKELGYEITWHTVEQYLNLLEKKGLGINYCQLVGHHALRAAVTGDVIRKPTKRELEEMKLLLDEAMQDGAFGVSCGFDIPQNVDTNEFVELCKVVSKYNGIFACHVRSMTDKFVEAVKEAIEIAEKAKVRTTISHLSVIGKANWGTVGTALKLIEEARDRGTEVVHDQIPYITGGGNYFNSELITLLPEWAQSNVEQLKKPKVREKVKRQIKKGISTRRYTREWYPLKFPLWEDMMKLTHCRNKELEGKTIGEIAKLLKKDPYDTILDLLVEDPTTKVVWIWVSEEDNCKTLKHPITMIGSDGGVIRPWEAERHKTGYPWERIPNPRVYGTFPHVLGKYVRRMRILSLEEAIRKMTSASAQFLRLKGRGLLKEGNYADIVIFDPKKVTDKANYVGYPQQYSEGIEYVLVNGKITIEQGKYKEVFAGKVLRHRCEGSKANA